MKRFTAYTSKAVAVLLSAIVCVSAYAGNPQRPLKKFENKTQKLVKNEKPRLIGKVKSNVAPTPLKAKPNKASSVERDILIDEDFSGVTGGSIDQPDTTVYLASSYYEPGIYIDPSMTKDGTWAGDFVHPAGEAVCLYSPHPMEYAELCTPLGDYSGTITVTCKVKAIPSWYVYDVDYETGENIYGCSTGASLNMMAGIDGYDSYNYAETDMQRYSTRLYANKGWTEVEVTFENYSANNDGYLVFYTEGAVIIDDIKVTTKADFIASPAIIGVTDFKADQFTVEWEPVRKAFNYYIDFYQRVYTSESGLELSENFDSDAPQEAVSSTSTVISDTEGVDGSKALVLNENDTLTTINAGATYVNADFYMKFVTQNEESYNALAYLEVLRDGKWESFGYFYLAAFTEGGIVDMEEEFKYYGGFANQYQAIRIIPTGLAEGEYVIIDNVNVSTNRPYELVRVVGPNSMDFSDYEEYSNYTCYDETLKTSFTFTDLDPEGEYHYGIRSHYMSTFSKPVSYHAFGVSAPEVLPATDIDSRGSFTANWNSAPKATGYSIDLYGIYESETDVENFALLEEDFDKIDESVTTIDQPFAPMALYNYEDTPLDDYTQQPGWIGLGNTVAIGMLGCEPVYYYYNDISTPELYVGNDDEISVTVKAYGTADDYLVLNVDGVNYGIPFVADADGNGYIDGTFAAPVTSETVKIRFTSYNYLAFMIDYISVNQNLKAGDIVRTRLETVDVEADATSYTFNNLADYDYDQFGYVVTSVYELAGNTTTSTPSETVVVNLVTGSSNVSTGIVDITTDKEVKVVGRYSIDGKLIDAPQKGVNILKMSDGSTRKVIVR